MRWNPLQRASAADEAAQRLVEHGSNVLVPSGKRSGALHELVGQFKSPIMLLLIFAAVLSAGLRDLTDATVILGIVVISGVLGFWQEHAASRAVAQLTSMIEATVPVMRTGQLVDVALADLVPGDPVKLTAGR